MWIEQQDVCFPGSTSIARVWLTILCALGYVSGTNLSSTRVPESDIRIPSPWGAHLVAWVINSTCSLLSHWDLGLFVTQHIQAYSEQCNSKCVFGIPMAFCTWGSALRQSFISPIFSTRLCEGRKGGRKFVLLCIPRAQLSACSRIVALWVFADQMNTCVITEGPWTRLSVKESMKVVVFTTWEVSGIPDSVRLSRTRGCDREHVGNRRVQAAVKSSFELASQSKDCQ